METRLHKSQDTSCNVRWSVTFSDDDVYDNVMLNTQTVYDLYPIKSQGECINQTDNVFLNVFISFPIATNHLIKVNL